LSDTLGMQINDHEMEHERRESDHTSMRTKDSGPYICRATMTKKYIVASAAIVRITAENLNTLISRKVHQATTANADRSRRF